MDDDEERKDLGECTMMLLYGIFCIGSCWVG